MSVTPLGTALLFATSIPVVGLLADIHLQLAFGGLAFAIALLGGGALWLWLAADCRSADPAAEPAWSTRMLPAPR